MTTPPSFVPDAARGASAPPPDIAPDAPLAPGAIPPSFVPDGGAASSTVATAGGETDGGGAAGASERAFAAMSGVKPGQTVAYRNPRTGAGATFSRVGAVPVLDAPITGVPQAVRGAKEVYGGLRSRNRSEAEAGAADVLEGAMQTGEPLAAATTLEAPVAAGVGLLTGYLGSKAAGAAAEKLGSSPQTARLASDVGGLAAGSAAGGVEALREAGAAADVRPQVAEATANMEDASLPASFRESEAERAIGLQQSPPGGAGAIAPVAGAAAERSEAGVPATDARVEAAQAFHDNGWGPEMAGDETVRQGHQIAQLAPHLYNDVVRGKVSPDDALAVAAKPPQEQRAAVASAGAPPSASQPPTATTGAGGKSGGGALQLARGIGDAYQNLVDAGLQKLGLGRSHPEVEAADPRLASELRLLDAAPQYLRAKAEADVKHVLGGMSRAQEKGFVLLADQASRDWLAANKPDEFRAYSSDPEIQAALARYKPLEEDLREARRELGGQVIEGDYVRRVYSQHVSGIGQKTAKGEAPAVPYDRIVTPQSADRQQRNASPGYYYQHGLHEFGPSYGARFVSTMMKLAEDRAAETFERHATLAEPGEDLPASIVYLGKTYYSPEEAKAIREAHPKQHIETYAVYSPAAGNARLSGRVYELAKAALASADESARAQGGAALRDLQARFLGPAKVVRALDHYGDIKAPSRFEPLNRFVREQRVGFGFGIPHFFNIARRIAEQVPAGVADPRGWLNAVKVLASRDLKARGMAGVDDPTFDALLKNAGISTKGAENFRAYAGGNLNPANWMRWLAEIGHENLYKPGGIDDRARLWLADYLKAHKPALSDAQVAERVNDAIGRVNRASWSDVQKAVGPYLVFPGWDFGSMNWVLRHPVRTAVPMAVLVMLANQLSYRTGHATRAQAFDPLAVHVGGRSYYPTAVMEPFARHLYGAPLRAAAGVMAGEPWRRALDLSQVPEDVFGTALNTVTPLITEPLEQTFNRMGPFDQGQISSEYGRKNGLKLYRRLRHAGESLVPAYGTLNDRGRGFDWRSVLGASLGLPNYATAKPKFRGLR